MASPTDAIVEEHFGTAEDLLTALAPTSSRWGPDPRDWAFRGQCEASWRLVPSILRRGRWRDYLSKDERAHADGPLKRMLMATAEWSAVAEFMDASDRAGLAIPEDMQDVRDTREHARIVTPRDPDVPEWPPRRLLSIVAMAQHYAVPTRLLDWTWRPRVAAYFAAESSASWQYAKKPLHDESFAIWGLRTRFVVFGWRQANDWDRVPVQVVTAPQASNPNLAAQAGLFTVDRDAADDDCFADTIARRFADSAGELATSLGTALRKFSVPHAQAGRLLRLLACEGVSAATVYPGHGGVARSLDEQRQLWDFVPHPGQQEPRS